MKNAFAAIGAALIALALVSSSSAAQLLTQNNGDSEIAQSGTEDIVGVVVGAGSFNTLAAALTAAGLVEALKGDGPFTVFVPTDDAFAALPAGPLDALLADIPALAAALDAAGLVETLKGEGPFTAFAPTDDAFAVLPAGTVDGLLADIPALTDVLLYHVVSGEVLAETVVGLDAAPTVQGSNVTIEVVDGKVILNGNVEVVTTDILASNGVIHVIDGVLLPPTEIAAPVPVPAAAGNAGLDSGSGIGTGWLAVIGGIAAAGLLGGARLATNARCD